MPTVKEWLGWLPTSVWDLNKQQFPKWDIIKDAATAEAGRHKHKGLYDKYSFFNPVLAARIISYWSKEDDNVVDPFAGRSTRGIVAMCLGRNYFGFDVSPTAVTNTKENIAIVRKQWEADEWTNKLGSAVLYKGDGCTMSAVPNEFADLVFSCPPYHQQEIYEPGKGQLSQIKDYQVFLNSLKVAALNCNRVLKPGHYAIWVVGDWRQKGTLIPFHRDVLNIFQWAKFELWDIVINRLHTPAVRGVAMAADRNRTVKEHEYVLVWRKSPGQEDK